MMLTGSAMSTRLALPVFVVAPLVLTFGWLTWARVRGAPRRDASGLESRKRDAGTKRPGDNAMDLGDEEVLRALLGSDRERFDELGRPVHVRAGESSRREQGAAPIDMRDVDE